MKSSSNTLMSPSLKPHTIEFLSKVIKNGTYQKAREEIINCHKTFGYKPKSMFLIGPSGAGKSTLVEKYTEDYPSIEHDDYTQTRVVYVSLDQKSTIKDTLSILLTAVGDLSADKGTMQQLMRRFENYVQSCAVELIIIDEIHHVLPAHTTASTQHFADLIKTIMDKTHVPFILVGLPESTRLLHANSRADIKDQLFRRTRQTVEIMPPALNSRTWLKLMSAYQKALGTIPCINLSSDEMLTRVHLATKGLNGRISNLLSEAIELTDGTEQLSLNHFAKAFLSANPSYELDKNPFEMTGRELLRYKSKVA